MTRRLHLLAAFLPLVLLFSGCGGEGGTTPDVFPGEIVPPDGETRDLSPRDSVGPDDRVEVPGDVDVVSELRGEETENPADLDVHPGEVVFSDLVAVHNEAVGLAAVITFHTDRPALGSVVVEGDGLEAGVVESGAEVPGLDHQVWVMGLPADQEVLFRARAVIDGDAEISEASASLQTGTLPEDFPEFLATASAPGSIQSGLTLLSLHTTSLSDPGAPSPDFDPALVIVDGEGRVVWYSRWPAADTLLGYTLLGDGTLGILTGVGLTVMNLKGERLLELSVAELGLEAPLHHDLAVLPNGNYLSLTSAVRPSTNPETPDVMISADVVVEFAPDGEQVNWWPIEGLLPEIPEGIEEGFGTQDTVFSLYNSNSITYDAADDGVIVGLEHTGQVVKFGRDDGELRWILGSGGTLELDGEGDWFSHTHGLCLAQNGNLLLYDNGDPEALKASGVHEYSVIPDPVGPGGVAHEVWTLETAFFSPAMGNVQELENGNRLICHGFKIVGLQDFSVQATIVEVTPAQDPETVFELTMPPQVQSEVETGFLIYRAYRIPGLYPWL